MTNISINGLMTGICDPQQKVIRNYERLEEIIHAVKTLGAKVVLTSGSWDLKHMGHSRYIRNARLRGDFLVVGVESDARIKKRKGEHRPFVGEEERAEEIAHLQYSNVVIIKDLEDEKWKLIKLVRPDVLVLSERTGYSGDETEKLEQYCGEIVVLESQAETSTTGRLRRLQMDILIPALTRIKKEVDAIQREIDPPETRPEEKGVHDAPPDTKVGEAAE